MAGFIQLKRDIMDWEWYQDPNVFRLYMHLMLKANFKDKRWQGQLIKRGQLVTSYGHLASELMLSVQSIRTALSKLQESGYIILSPTNRFTLITVVDYEKNQSPHPNSNKLTNTPVTIQQQSNNKPLTTTKERKKNNKVNKEKIEVRRQDFKKQVFEHSKYDFKILKGFYDYWSEFNSNKLKMRFEKDDFFEIEKRLEKWSANEKLNHKKTNNEARFFTNR